VPTPAPSVQRTEPQALPLRDTQADRPAPVASLAPEDGAGSAGTASAARAARIEADAARIATQQHPPTLAKAGGADQAAGH
jgi:hypothetical protein